MGRRWIDVWRGIGGIAEVIGLSGLAACGDDDGGALGAPGVGDEVDDGATGAEAPPDGPGVVLGACDLLEVAEIEEQLGMLGPVREGEVKPLGCLWPIGQDTRLSGLDLQILYHPADELARHYPDGSAEAALAEVRLVPEVPGIGDEALLDYGTL